MSIARFEHISQAQWEKDTAGREVLPLDAIPLPVRATAGSAGYDFFSSIDLRLEPGQSVTVPSGVRALIDPGWVLLLLPRSSAGFKYGVMLRNTVGVIDSDYSGAENEGHLRVGLTNTGDRVFELKAGERMCQGIFLPYGLAEEDAVTLERTGGFGSTGR